MLFCCGFGSCFGVTPSTSRCPSGQTMTRSKVIAFCLPPLVSGMASVDGSALMEKRFHGGGVDPIEAFAKELVALKCKVIFAGAPYGIQAALKATNTIPIVGVDLESDPVASGWAQSLARPGGNLTGLFLDLPELGGKQIELLREAAPKLSHLAVLWDVTIGKVQFRATELAAGAAKLTLQSLPIRRVEDVKDAFEEATRKRVSIRRIP
jgi:ABC-type uncharacterized transport system substrate-binding protein